MRTALLVLLGAWLGLLLASWIMASVNFRTAQAIGARPSPELLARLGPLPAAERELAFRHLASEINRWMFRSFAGAQLVLALGLLAACWGQGGARRALALAVLATVAVQALGLIPAMASLGRGLDFTPRPLPADVGRRFGLLHAGYVVLDFARAALLAALIRALAR